MENTLPFDKLTKLRNYSSAFSQLGNDYIYTRITPAEHVKVNVMKPIRVSGITFCLLLGGTMDIEINSERHRLTPRSVLTVHDGSMIRISSDNWSSIDAYMVVMSTQFLHDINLDLNAFDFSLIERKPLPVIDNLTDDNIRLLTGYMDLLYLNALTNEDNVCIKNASRSLIQSLIYQMMQIKHDRSRLTEEATDGMQNRRYAYVQDFMRLVQIHHFKERSLNFYADKLFISPKYLSRIIKESTGYSAADWIDQFVILEAKNMLRFSNKNIQQIAYALNFSTQSSFGKFFKHITGMSPSDYQKT